MEIGEVVRAVGQLIFAGQYFQRRTWLAVLCLVIALNLIVSALAYFAPTYDVVIAPSATSPEQGVAYSAPINFGADYLYRLPSDGSAAPSESLLTVYESGKSLGPAHSLHSDIRNKGKGRFSHWQQTLYFSSSDGSDPRSNGRIYSIMSPTKLRVQFPAALVLLDIGFLIVFRWRVVTMFRTHSTTFIATGVATALVAGFMAAFGFFGVLKLANGEVAGDTALVLATVWHALIGCLLSGAVWAAGAGIVLLATHDPRSRLAKILIPGFPVSLVVLAILVAVALLVPQGRWVAFFLWLICLLPLLAWRPPLGDCRQMAVALVGIAPLALIFGIWMGLLWHGPTETVAGWPSGDEAFYANTVWALAASPFPLVNFGYELSSPPGYFNRLFPALGAALIGLPEMDPFLFITASGAATFILLTGVMLHIYIANRTPEPRSGFAASILIFSLLATNRYPFWVVESIPVVHVSALAIAVYWMAEQGRSKISWLASATALGFAGSVLSKVGAAAVLVPLGFLSFTAHFKNLPPTLLWVLFGFTGLFGVYCAVMLWHFLPLFLSLASVGPQSFTYLWIDGMSVSKAWPYLLRDFSALALALLAWRLALPPVAIALTIGLTTFLCYVWLFHINYVCVVLLLGLIAYADPRRLLEHRFLATFAFLCGLPAALLTDPAGISSGVVWTVCLGGTTVIAIASVAPVAGLKLPVTFRQSALAGLLTSIVCSLVLLGVARGNLIVNSGSGQSATALTPDVRRIWRAVRELTPRDALIFTDQVGESGDLLTGWNTFAFSGQRQTFVSNHVMTDELRFDLAKRVQVFAVNDAVLSGELAPSEVPTRGRYSSFFAVVSRSRAVPISWPLIYESGSFRLYKIMTGLH